MFWACILSPLPWQLCEFIPTNCIYLVSKWNMFLSFVSVFSFASAFMCFCHSIFLFFFSFSVKSALCHLALMGEGAATEEWVTGNTVNFVKCQVCEILSLVKAGKNEICLCMRASRQTTRALELLLSHLIVFYALHLSLLLTLCLCSGS